MAPLLRPDEPRDKITAYRCYHLLHLGMFVPQRSAFPFWNMQVFAWMLQPLLGEKWHRLPWVGSTSTVRQKEEQLWELLFLSLSVLLKPSVPPKKHTPRGLPQLICLDVSKFWAENTFSKFYLSQLHKG